MSTDLRSTASGADVGTSAVPAASGCVVTVGNLSREDATARPIRARRSGVGDGRHAAGRARHSTGAGTRWRAADTSCKTSTRKRERKINLYPPVNADISEPLPLVRGRCVTVPRDRILPDSRPNSTPRTTSRAHVDPRRTRSRPRPALPADIPPREEATTRFQARAACSRPRGAPRKRKCASSYADLVPGSNITSRLRGWRVRPPGGPRVFTRATTHVPKLAPDPGARPARRPPAATPRVSRREDDAAAVADSSSSLRSAPSPPRRFSRDAFRRPPRRNAGPVQRPEACVGRRLLLRSADAARANGPFDPHPHVIVAYRADLALHVARKEPLSRRRRGGAGDDVHQPRERDDDDERRQRDARRSHHTRSDTRGSPTPRQTPRSMPRSPPRARARLALGSRGDAGSSEPRGCVCGAGTPRLLRRLRSSSSGIRAPTSTSARHDGRRARRHP